VVAEALAESLDNAFAERLPDSGETPDWWSMARCGSRANL
jgi:hypothetical protein